jgi:hypothetical protein
MAVKKAFISLYVLKYMVKETRFLKLKKEPFQKDAIQLHAKIYFLYKDYNNIWIHLVQFALNKRSYLNILY